MNACFTIVTAWQPAFPKRRDSLALVSRVGMEMVGIAKIPTNAFLIRMFAVFTLIAVIPRAVTIAAASQDSWTNHP